jgi:hypothetical protein
MFDKYYRLSDSDRAVIQQGLLSDLEWNFNQRFSEMKETIERERQDLIEGLKEELSSMKQKDFETFRAEKSRVLQEETEPIRLEIEELGKLKEKYESFLQDITVFVERIETMEELWRGSMNLILQNLEMNKKEKQELINELSELKLKLTKTKGEEYKKILERYNILKEQLKGE